MAQEQVYQDCWKAERNVSKTENVLRLFVLRLFVDDSIDPEASF